LTLTCPVRTQHTIQSSTDKQAVHAGYHSAPVAWLPNDGHDRCHVVSPNVPPTRPAVAGCDAPSSCHVPTGRSPSTVPAHADTDAEAAAKKSDATAGNDGEAVAVAVIAGDDDTTVGDDTGGASAVPCCPHKVDAHGERDASPPDHGSDGAGLGEGRAPSSRP